MALTTTFGGPREDALHREAPHNVEAEQALIGAILVNNDAAARVSDFLRAEHFHLPVHQRIYEAASRLIERGQIANPVTLRHLFEGDQALADVGGAQYLGRLAAQAVTVISVEHYGRLIYDLSQRRSLIEIGEDMVNRAYDASLEDPAPQQIEAAESRLYKLAETGRSDRGFTALSLAMRNALNEAEAASKRDGQVSGVASLLRDLDDKLGGLHPSDLIILAARPAMGKTALATNIAFNAANQRWEAIRDGRLDAREGAVVAVFSLEMSAEQLATRLLSEQAEIASNDVRRGRITAEQFARLANAAARLNELPLFIDDTPALTIAQIRARARRLKRQHGLGLVVVDYLQLVQPSGDSRADGRVREVTEITQGLKALAKELDVPVLALSQLSRAPEQRDDKRPLLSDLRESGSIEQDADVVLFLYREAYYHQRKEPPPEKAEEHREWQEKGERIHHLAELIIGKQRHGPTGTVMLHFRNEFTKFSNLEFGAVQGDDL